MALTKPSPGQRRVLDAFVRLTRKRGYSPTYREVMTHCGYASTNVVAQQVQALVRKGWLCSEPGKARTVRLTREAMECHTDLRRTS